MVSLVFWLIDRWGAGAATGKTAGGLNPASGSYEVHERPPAAAAAEVRAVAQASVAPADAFERPAREGAFARDFLLGSARTSRLQAGLLAAAVVVLIVMVVQTMTSSHRSGRPEAAHAVPSGGAAWPQQERQLGMLRPAAAVERAAPGHLAP
jgi:hypothetical protein